MKKNIVKEKSVELSFMAIDIYKELTSSHEFVLSKQFLRSATSVGANVHEAEASYSRKEFAAKMSIANKEARETEYWVSVLKHASFIKHDWTKFDRQLNEIIKMLTAIVKTTYQREFSKQ
jgi:four helix bundle protein